MRHRRRSGLRARPGSAHRRATPTSRRAGEAARERAARKELTQLALDEAWQAVTVAASARLGEKGSGCSWTSWCSAPCSGLRGRYP